MPCHAARRTFNSVNMRLTMLRASDVIMVSRTTISTTTNPDYLDKLLENVVPATRFELVTP